MELVFSDQPFPEKVTKSIFLAGPSPRYHKGDTPSLGTWRHAAIDLLAQLGYDGVVYIPLPKSAFVPGKLDVDAINYFRQVAWEKDALNRADVIFFYVDRKEDNQGLTTNVEFGKYIDSGRLVYARPADAVKVRYLDNMIFDKDLVVHFTLMEGLNECVERTSDAVTRYGDEVLVPNIIFKSDQFQEWYKNVKFAGNRLRGFEVKSIITFNKDKILFGFAAWVNVYITAEDRYKSNEWIFSRVGVSYVVPYYEAEHGRQFVLTREFRSPANNPLGYLFEFPGGSSVKPGISPMENASKELYEETGLSIDQNRFKFLGCKQTFATYLTMNMFAVKVKLTKEEYEQVLERVNSQTVLGENEEECITLHIATEEEIVKGVYPCDWTQIGLMKAIDF